MDESNDVTSENGRRLSTHEHVQCRLADTVAGRSRSMVTCNAGKCAGHIHDDLPVQLFNRWEKIPRDEGRASDIGDDRVSEVDRFKVERTIVPTVLHVRDGGKQSVPRQ